MSRTGPMSCGGASDGAAPCLISILSASFSSARHGRWKTLTFLAAPRSDALVAPCVIDGPINGAVFRAYVEQFLEPTLSRGDIVVIDSLGSHRSRAVRDAIVGLGARRAFLPPCAPDRNPIDQVFAKVQPWMRLAQERCIAAVNDRIANLVRATPAAERANDIRNAGYASI